MKNLSLVDKNWIDKFEKFAKKIEGAKKSKVVYVDKIDLVRLNQLIDAGFTVVVK